MEPRRATRAGRAPAAAPIFPRNPSQSHDGRFKIPTAPGLGLDFDADELARVLEAGDEIMKVCIAAGGSLTGEHGVGLEKIAGMEWLYTREELAAQCRVREAWDPHVRMNPGKTIPLRACMETRTRDQGRT